MTETENRHTLLQLNSLHLPKLEAQLLPPQFSICFSVFHYNSLFKKKKKVQQASKKGFTSMTMASTNIGLKSHGRGLMSHGRGLKSHGRGLRLGRAEARKQTIFRTRSILLPQALSLLPIVPPIPSLTCLRPLDRCKEELPALWKRGGAGKGNKG